MISYQNPDLTQHPPRSVRVRLGGFVMLARSLDKARAKAAGKLGEYAFPNPMDKYLLEFAGVDTDAFFEAAKTGKSDSEMLAWFNGQAAIKRARWEITAWSNWIEALSPGDARRHGLYAERISKHAPGREDIHSVIEWLDVDDYVSFGGKA